MALFEKKPWFLYIIILPITAAAVILFYLGHFADIRKQDPSRPTDFLASLAAGEIVKEGKIRELYNYETQKNFQNKVSKNDEPAGGLLSFRNPPTTAAAYSLLPAQDPVKSFWIAVSINFASILIALALLCRTLVKTSLIVTVALFTPSLWMSLVGGHLNGMLLLVAVLAYLSMKRDLPKLAGGLTVFFFLKPTFLLLVPFMLMLSKDKKQAVSFSIFSALAVLAAIAANSLIYGPDFAATYVPYVINTEQTVYGTDISNNTNIVSVIYAVYGWLGVSYNKWVAVGIVFGANLLVLVILYKKRWGMDIEQKFALICLFVPLLNLHTLHADVILHLVPLALLTPVFINKKKWFAAIGLLLILTALPWYSLAHMEWLVTVATLGVALLLLTNGQNNSIQKNVATSQ